MRWLLVSLLGIALLASQAKAQTAQIDKAAPPPAQQVVVNGGKTDVEASREFAAGKIIIGKQRILDAGVPTVGELLTREPAISVGKDGRLGLLGLPGYTQVLVDGQPPQGVDVFAIDLVHIERIEIIKSATAATGPFGIAGTINIIRKKAERKALTTLSGNATSTAGRVGGNLAWSNNQVVADGPLSYNLRLSARRMPMPRASQYVETRDVPGAASQLQYDGDLSGPGNFDTLLAGGELTWAFNPHNKLSFSPELGSFKDIRDTQEQRRWPDGHSLLARRHNEASMQLVSLPLQWNWTIDDDSSLAIKLSTSHPSNSTTGALLENGFGLGTQNRSHRQDDDRRNSFLDLNFNTELKSGHAISAGANLKRNQVETRYADFIDGTPDISLAVLGNDSAIRTDSLRLFAQDDWRIDRTLALNAGLSAEHRNYDIDEGRLRNRAQFNMWSPSLHLAKKIGGDSKRQFRVSVARTFQAPESTQLLVHPSIDTFAPCPRAGLCGANTADTADSGGNPALQPERALGLNASYTRGIGRNSEVSLEVYTRDIRNKIGSEIAYESVAWANTARYVLRPANLGEAKVSGIDLGFRLTGKDISNTAPDAELHGSLGFAHAELSDIPGPDNRIEGQTPWRAKLGGSYSMTAVPVKLGFEANYLPGDWVRDGLNTRVYESNRATLGVNAAWKLGAKSRVLINLDNLLHKTRTRYDDYLEANDVLRLSTRSADYARFGIRFETSL